jgi:hypothetical protein
MAVTWRLSLALLVLVVLGAAAAATAQGDNGDGDDDISIEAEVRTVGDLEAFEKWFWGLIAATEKKPSIDAPFSLRLLSEFDEVCPSKKKKKLATAFLSLFLCVLLTPPLFFSPRPKREKRGPSPANTHGRATRSACSPPGTLKKVWEKKHAHTERKCMCLCF